MLYGKIRIVAFSYGGIVSSGQAWYELDSNVRSKTHENNYLPQKPKRFFCDPIVLIISSMTIGAFLSGRFSRFFTNFARLANKGQQCRSDQHNWKHSLKSVCTKYRFRINWSQNCKSFGWCKHLKCICLKHVFKELMIITD